VRTKLVERLYEAAGGAEHGREACWHVEKAAVRGIIAGFLVNI